jgi:hypothetical protein
VTSAVQVASSASPRHVFQDGIAGRPMADRIHRESGPKHDQIRLVMNGEIDRREIDRQEVESSV